MKITTTLLLCAVALGSGHALAGDRDCRHEGRFGAVHHDHFERHGHKGKVHKSLHRRHLALHAEHYHGHRLVPRRVRVIDVEPIYRYYPAHAAKHTGIGRSISLSLHGTDAVISLNRRETRRRHVIDGYLDSYRYRGKVYHTTMDSHPGEWVQVKV